jgi:ATP-dependent DNA helicase RecQ
MAFPSHTELLGALRTQFGHEEFWPGQERLIQDILDGRDALAVLPTGGGKSLVYELAAQFLPGLTVVVSPLLALMRDQVESLGALGLEAGVVSSLENREPADARLLYVTPERFLDEEFMAGRREVSLLVVDEAHSISEWGESFRPAYLQLADASLRLGRPPILALTATASPWLRREIIDNLRLGDPDVVVHGIDRPNLHLEVRRVEEEREDRRVLRQLFDEDLEGSGIVYTATTRAAAETAAWLREWGIAADFYHGQRRKSDRERVQAAFMAGHLQVIAATNAFGLGVDKADVRFVVHRDVPGSLEAYYQEAGRAGRDGEPARCILIYRPGDLGRAAFLSAGGELTREEVRIAHRGLVKQRSGSMAEMTRASGLGRGDFARLVELLEREGLMQRGGRRLRLVVDDFDPDAIPLEREAGRRAFERSRLDMMRAYAETRDCRWRFVLNYFGEEPSWECCKHCDNEAALEPCATTSVSRSDAPFAAQDRVQHPTLGTGVVHTVKADSLTVLFDQAGYKTLALDLVVEQHLLSLVD